MAARVAAVQVPTQSGRAALHDMSHDLLLGGTRRVCAAIGLRVGTENVGDLTRRPVIRLEAESVEALKSLIWRCRKGQVRGHVVERSSRAAGETLGPAKQSQPAAPAPDTASNEAPGLAGMLASRNRVIAQLSAVVANRPKSSGGPCAVRASDTSAHRNNPLVHFLEIGAYEGRRPNPVFDP